ncbi:MAG: hypothetical protein WCJ64_14530 [Rhodospirillaceae bacterium]
MPAPKRTKQPDPRQQDFLNILANTLHSSIGAQMILPEPPDLAPFDGRFDDDQAIRRHLNHLIQASGVNREIIAERMSKYSGHPVTKTMLDSWTGAGRPNAFPLHYLRALIRACDAGNEAEHAFLVPILDGTGWSPVDAARARLIALGQYAGAIVEAVFQMIGLANSARGGRS